MSEQKQESFYIYYMGGFWNLTKKYWIKVCEEAIETGCISISKAYALKREPNWLRRNKVGDYPVYIETDNRRQRNYFEIGKYTTEDFINELEILRQEDQKRAA